MIITAIGMYPCTCIKIQNIMHAHKIEQIKQYQRKKVIVERQIMNNVYCDEQNSQIDIEYVYICDLTRYNFVSITATDLPPSDRFDHDSSFGDPYVKVCLEPVVDERVRQSSVKRKTANPFFNEYFKFPATYDDIKESTLVFFAYDYDKFSRHKLVGEVRIDLSKVETSNSVEMWCDVQKQNPVSMHYIHKYSYMQIY